MDETEDIFTSGGYENDSGDEDVGDDFTHNKLIDSIISLDGKRKSNRKARSETTKNIGEASLSTSSDADKIRLHQLMGALQNTTGHGMLKKQLMELKRRNKTLDTPLSKPEQGRIERRVVYEKTSKDLTLWDPIVKENRNAPQLSFPLERPNLNLQTTDQVVRSFKPRTPLEVEVAAMLRNNPHKVDKRTQLTRAEMESMKAMSLEEARERRAELQKYRALLSYQESKAKRQKKIKSKKFHRILRKEKAKQLKKEMTDLEKKDPEAYAEAVKLAEKRRVEERMSLKHRGGSKFMKNQLIHAKYDKDARNSVQEMLQHSRELTKKDHVSESESENEAEGQNEAGVTMATDDTAPSGGGSHNPWLAHSAPSQHKPYAKLEEIRNEASSDDDEDSSDENDEQNQENNGTGEDNMNDQASDNEDEETDDEIEKAFDILENKKKISKQKTNKKGKDVKIENSEEESPEESEGEDEEMITQTMKRKRTLADFNEDSNDEEVPEKVLKVRSRKKAKPRHKKKKKEKQNRENQNQEAEVRVDPKNSMTLETKINQSAIPKILDGEDQDEDDQRMTISEAFADDDVIDDFTAEKQEAEERDKPKDINLTLPGWGDWGGAGIQPSKKKTKRFLIKAPPLPPRKDKHLENVIISEAKDNSIAKHQVSKLPFPYTNVLQFESDVKAPIGKLWNPEGAFKEITKPKIVTKIGTIIDPIDKEVTFKKNKINSKTGPKQDNDTKSKKGHGKTFGGGKGQKRGNQKNKK
ncbi:unnamed protein product [Owenia fusiformis]|uniref:Uncharacterized protein n=1 Tax=Owenia fusiformis TaxID=6347 RepID=A0A8S4Q2C2_OWEFU|nr:unnamed protein product [Owenia fusiformis]